VSGFDTTWTNETSLTVGLSSSGTLSITNGGAVSASFLRVGQSGGGNGTVTVTNGGILTTGNNETDVAASAGSIGTITVSGSGSTWNDEGTVMLGSGYQGGDGILRIASGGTVNAPQIDIGGSSTVAFSGDSTLNSPLLLTGGVLEGSGSAAGSVLNIDGSIQFNNGILALNIDSTSSATDMLNITSGAGLMIFGGDTLTINLLNGNQLTQPAYVLAVLSGGGFISGQFDDLNIPAGYTVDYGTGVPGELRLVAVVPEPGACGMMLIGLGIFVAGEGWRRFRRG
jgi:T5SS/PEP-CTERM-associated repeat protein